MNQKIKILFLILLIIYIFIGLTRQKDIIFNGVNEDGLIVNRNLVYLMKSYIINKQQHIDAFVSEPILNNIQSNCDKQVYDKKSFIQYSEVSAVLLIYPLLLGKCLIANYYKEKYNVDIRIVHSKKEIMRQIKIIRKYNHSCAIGFSLVHPNTIHSSSVIYIKNNRMENIFISDSVESYHDIFSPYSNLRLFPNVGINISIVNSIRQKDSLSCITGSIVYLKDALQVKDFNSAIKNIRVDPESKLLFYSEPEEMLKSVQVSKYFKAVGADFSKELATAKGKTLAEKLKKHRRVIEVSHGVNKEINAYLLDKGHRFAEIIEAEYNAYSNAELNRIFAERSGQDLSRFEKNYVAKELTLQEKEKEFLRAAFLGHTYRLLQLYSPVIANARNDAGEDALILAAKGGHVGMFKLLLKKNASFDLQQAVKLIKEKIVFLEKKKNKTINELSALNRCQAMLSSINESKFSLDLEQFLMNIIHALDLQCLHFA